MIYLDNAATSFPKPLAVRRAMARALEYYGGNPGRGGHVLSQRVGEKIFTCRENASEFFGGWGPEYTVFTANATMALNMAILGTKKPGGHVVSTQFEHNSVLRPLAALERADGVAYTLVPPSLEDDAETVRRVEEAIRPNTYCVVCTHASNVCGRILPVGEIAALCRRRGLLCIVDASQSAGSLPIDMRALGIDLLCMAGHKGLMGAGGTGLLLLSPDVQVAPILFGGTGTNSNSVQQPEDYPERLESGTINTHGIISMDAGIGVLRAAPRYQEERRLAQQLYQGLRGIEKVELYCAFDPGRYVGIVPFNIRGRGSTEVANLLAAEGICVRGGLHCAPATHRYFGTQTRGMVRASVGYYTTAAEISSFVEAVRRLA